MQTINIAASHIFQQVDNFVKDVLIQMNPLSISIINTIKLTIELNRLYHLFYDNYDDDYWYSDSIRAFVGATQACMGMFQIKNIIWNEYSTRQFLYYLGSYQTVIRRSVCQQYNQELQNRQELEDYVRQAINKYAKSLIVMVTLSYKPEYRHLVTLENAYYHFERLREHISNKQTCFNNLVANSWALEQGIEKGMHCHLWLLYDGSKRQSDFYIGRDIGDKWLKITDGVGEYHNSNNEDNKAYYASFGRLGIGRIHRDNIAEVENAVATALYLTKPDKIDQQLVVKLNGMRTFGRGILR